MRIFSAAVCEQRSTSYINSEFFFHFGNFHSRQNFRLTLESFIDIHHFTLHRKFLGLRNWPQSIIIAWPIRRRFGRKVLCSGRNSESWLGRWEYFLAPFILILLSFFNAAGLVRVLPAVTPTITRSLPLTDKSDLQCSRGYYIVLTIDPTTGVEKSPFPGEWWTLKRVESGSP